MEIKIEAAIGPCTEFSLNGKRHEPVQVVISPLKITDDNGTLKIISGCNLWKSCDNQGCQFSLAARGAAR